MMKMSVAAGLAAVGVGAAMLLVLAPAVDARGCAGAPIVAAGAERVVEALAIDMTASTASTALYTLYSTGADGIVERAASEGALLRIVALGASGVGAGMVFQRSFAPVSDDELFNLAASNAARCWAKLTVRRLFSEASSAGAVGTDVAGTLAALITTARSLAADRARVTVTALGDGCQSPSRSGLNRELTDLCGKLAAGKSTAAILASHADEFALPDASGVTLVMRGVGVGRRPEAASTRLAKMLVGFWMTVCRRAHAKACLIGSDLP